MKKFYGLQNDYICKRVFSRRQHLLQIFLSLVLNIPLALLTGLQFLNPQQDGDNPKAHAGILDFHLVLKNAIHIDLEIQLQKSQDIIKRLLFYFSKIYTYEFSRGEKYDSLPKVICILVADFVLDKKLPKALRKLVLSDCEGLEFETLEVYILEIPSIRKGLSTGNEKLDLWLKLLDAKTMEAVMALYNFDTDVDEAIDNILYLNKEDSERYLAYLKEKEELEKQDLLETGKAEGLKKGLKKGKEEGLKKGREEGRLEKIANAKNILLSGIESEKVAMWLNLPLAEVEQLAKELGLSK